MAKVVNVARINGTIYARVSPTRYRWVSRSYGGSFSNATPGDAVCVHMEEREARRLVASYGDDWEVRTTGQIFTSRIQALGAAVLDAVKTRQLEPA